MISILASTSISSKLLLSTSLRSLLGRINDSSIVLPLSLLSLVSLVPHVSQRFRELLRLICGHNLLGCQIALLLNEKLVDTGGDMLVSLTHPNPHVVERLLVRDIVDYGDVVCTPVSVEQVRRDVGLTTAVQHCHNIVVFVGGEFASTLAEVDITACRRSYSVRAESHTLLLLSSGERSSCADFRHEGLDTVALAIASPHDGLIVSLMTLPHLEFIPLCWLPAATLSASLATNSSSALLEETLLLGEWVHAQLGRHRLHTSVLRRQESNGGWRRLFFLRRRDATMGQPRHGVAKGDDHCAVTTPNDALTPQRRNPSL